MATAPRVSPVTPVLPFALARRSLGRALGEEGPSRFEERVLRDVRQRVADWDSITLYYDFKPEQSRGTEAVLNALILANHDVLEEQTRIATDTVRAFDHLWGTQRTAGDDAGGWPWLEFNLAPWESRQGEYYGATLAALAVGMAPGHYASNAAIEPNLALLRSYLGGRFERQNLHNQTMALWASVRIRHLLERSERESLLSRLFAVQQEDGGWSLSSLGAWERLDGSTQDQRSDGYATGLIVYVLKKIGLTPSDERLAGAIAWLNRQQDPERGSWRGASVNKQRDSTTHEGLFMHDSATAYAVMALLEE